MFKQAVIVATFAVGSISPAFAATTPTISFTDGNYALPSGTSATVFQGFNTQPANTPFVAGPNESTSGSVFVRQNSIIDVTADTDASTTNRYLSIENGSYGVSFAAPVQFFSFVIGTLDAYNTLSLTFGDGSSATYSGRQIIGEGAAGPFNSGTSGRVNFDLGGQAGITSAVFSSSQAAFEIDSLASAVPEPATWATMMLGLGIVGYSMRRRQKTALRVRFA